MDVQSFAAGFRDRAGSALSRRFGVDPRALAALRVSLGLLLLTDLYLRSRDLVAFYTDAGVLPRSVLREQFGGIALVSIHARFGSPWAVGLLFLVAGAFAVALAVGYRTRLATVVSFVLVVSLHARNPVLLNGGDSMLRRLLLWGAFLPLGRRWSVDALRRARDGARRETERSGRVASVASAALLLQVVLVYTTNAVYKLRGELWVSGEAILYVFNLDQLTVGLGETLAQYPALLRAFDRVWLGLLVTSVGLLLLTGWARAAFAALFVGMHLGMALTMRITVFPLLSIAGLIPFLPGVFWDAAGARVRESRLGEWLDETDAPARVAAALPNVRRRVPGGVRRLGRWASRARPPVVGGLLALVLVWNAAALGYVALPEDVSSAADPEEYRWDMFAPEPRTTDGWYVVPGRLESGERADVFHRRAVRWDEPPDVAASYRNVRWFKYMMDLRASAAEPLRPHFADYLCERWNATHEDDVERVALYYVEQPVRLDGPDPTNRVKMHEQSCGSA
ncbi:HTTM domain-containing protein (plasmid) [Halorussus limi]|uniref:HTTM domain-containing protein n=1 Tax=Halorussus limi TaxID=2938695 RepID=A0A8U0HZC3_9EURY|nr:HTTM domain-containing protein [Halorussus limi]UPV76502.1 HTTM domain-containing protein [Halorussus limi]